MQKENVVVTCPPCGENVAVATKREFLNKEPSLTTPHLPYGALPPQVGKLTARGFTARSVTPQSRYAGYSGRTGFTLIELLVVVLIIGILAAVAVPQYQKAVLKSRFATIKDLTRSLAQAEEIYYLANSEYTHDFEALDVTTQPSDDEKTQDTWAQRKWDWGKCMLEKSSAYVSCELQVNGSSVMGYQIYFNHGTPQTWCVAYSGDLNSPSNKICKDETGKTQPKNSASGSTFKVWVY